MGSRRLHLEDLHPVNARGSRELDDAFARLPICELEDGRRDLGNHSTTYEFFRDCGELFVAKPGPVEPSQDPVVRRVVSTACHELCGRDGQRPEVGARPLNQIFPCGLQRNDLASRKHSEPQRQGVMREDGVCSVGRLTPTVQLRSGRPECLPRGLCGFTNASDRFGRLTQAEASQLRGGGVQPVASANAKTAPSSLDMLGMVEARVHPVNLRAEGPLCSDEISELEERLLALVRARPGKSTTVFSEEIGQSVPSLQRPMSKLRAEGRVRCVGERNMARYFPAVGPRSKG